MTNEVTVNMAMMNADNAHKRIDRVDIQLDIVKNRPPVWATFFMSGLTFLLGASLTLLKVLT